MYYVLIVVFRVTTYDYTKESDCNESMLKENNCERETWITYLHWAQ